MTETYCFVDDCLQALSALCTVAALAALPPPIRRDAEVITIALLEGSLQVATLKQTYRLVAAKRVAIPHPPTYAEWLRRLAYVDVARRIAALKNVCR